MVGSNNDINMLQRSLVFMRLSKGQNLECNYEINGHQYTKRYYLVAKIYHDWSTFVKPICTILIRDQLRCFLETSSPMNLQLLHILEMGQLLTWLN